MGACNQGGKVLEFLWWGRHCRHSFGFSRNEMKGALYQTLKSFRFLVWVRNVKKENFQIFIFGVLGVKGSNPLRNVHFLNEMKKVGKCILRGKD